MGPSHRSCDTGARPHCRESPAAVCQVPGALLEWQAGTCVKLKQNTQHVTNLRAYCCIQKAFPWHSPCPGHNRPHPVFGHESVGVNTGRQGVDPHWQAYSYIRRQAHRQEHGCAVAEYTLAGMYVPRVHTLQATRVLCDLAAQLAGCLPCHTGRWCTCTQCTCAASVHRLLHPVPRAHGHSHRLQANPQGGPLRLAGHLQYGSCSQLHHDNLDTCV